MIRNTLAGTVSHRPFIFPVDDSEYSARECCYSKHHAYLGDDHRIESQSTHLWCRLVHKG